MKRVTNQIVINTTKENVFTFISDLSNYPKWNNAKSSTITSGDGKQSSIYKVTVPTFLSQKTIQLEVINYQFPDTFSFKNQSLLFSNETGFILSGENEVTVTIFKEAEEGFMSLGYITSKTEQELLEMLTQIKSHIENGTIKTVENNKLTVAQSQISETENPQDPTNESDSGELIIKSPFYETPEEVKRRYKKRNY